MTYRAAEERYDHMPYKQTGKSGLKLPKISLGLWHNFGSVDRFDNAQKMIHTAFDLGITHFDLANNYGPEPGSAEENFGKILAGSLKPYRDELIISTKAGYRMWPGPYGDGGSRKYLMASLDQSLQRMGLDYVDIFYHHRMDPETPIEESMQALHDIVKSGKALYVGLSNYSKEATEEASQLLKALGTTCLIHQPRYSMMEREPENGLFDVLKSEGIGSIAYSPLFKGVLTDKYLKGIPADSRAAGSSVFLSEKDLHPELLSKVKLLNDLALERGQSLAQMALAWILRREEVTSVLIGASKPEQILDSAKAMTMLAFTAEELEQIEGILAK